MQAKRAEKGYSNFVERGFWVLVSGYFGSASTHNTASTHMAVAVYLG